MTTISVAVAELLRVAPWALRALGFTYGVAERGAALITLAEVMQHGGLTTLRTREEALIRSAALPNPPRAAIERPLGAEGRSMIQIGPAMVDVLTNRAAVNGSASAQLRAVVDPELVAPVLTLAARQAVAAIARFGDSAGAHANARPYRWAISAPSAAGILLLTGDSNDEDFLSSVFDRTNSESEQLNRWLSVSEKSAGAVANTIDVSVIRDLGSDTIERIERDPRSINVTELMAQANRSGIQARLEDVAHMYELERRTWAPTSDRSQAQAGF